MRDTHLSQVIKSQNKIIYTVVSKINNMRCAIKKIQTQYYCYGYSINTTGVTVVKVLLIRYRLLEFGSINFVRHCSQSK